MPDIDRLHTYEKSAIATELLNTRHRKGLLMLQDAPRAVKMALRLSDELCHLEHYFLALQFALNFITTLEKEPQQ